MYIIYTDGAYSFSRKQGGCAFIILKDNVELISYSKAFVNCTNNEMELIAPIIALESIEIPSDILIYSDSMYVINTAMKLWQRSSHKALWKRYDAISKFHKSIMWKHVKGHEDNYYNNKCDELAVEASHRI